MGGFFTSTESPDLAHFKTARVFFVRKIYFILERDECTLIHDFHKSLFFIKAGQSKGTYYLLWQINSPKMTLKQPPPTYARTLARNYQPVQFLRLKAINN